MAQIQGRPIYAVANVAVIPVSSQADALRAITQARKDVTKTEPDRDSESDDDTPDNATDGTETEIGSVPSSPIRERDNFHARGISVSSIAEDVIEKRVRFDKFAANWLSRKNLGLPRPAGVSQNVPESPFNDTPVPSKVNSQAIDEAGEEGETTEPKSIKDDLDGQSKQEQTHAMDLLPKLLRYTKLLFSSHNFFFAYDYDLTRAFNAQEELKGQLPLHRAVDPLVCFFSPILAPPKYDSKLTCPL